LLKIIQLWREPTMDAENLIVNDGCDWEAIEAMNELFP